MRALLSQFARFGIVGLGGLVIDFTVFNVLRLTVLSPDLVHEGPFVAKVISTTLAIIANWMGNRYWTFSREHRSPPLREGIEFAIVSVGGMAISLLCLWFSHYVLGFTSPLADNIVNYGIGLALGTAFRFTFYRLWVFRPRAAPLAGSPAVAEPTPVAEPARVAEPVEAPHPQPR